MSFDVIFPGGAIPRPSQRGIFFRHAAAAFAVHRGFCYNMRCTNAFVVFTNLRNIQ